MAADGQTRQTIVRASSLSGYADCPRRGAARIFKTEIEANGHQLRETPYGIGAAIGTAVHKAAFVTLAEKAKDGKTPPLSVATDATAESLKETIKLGVMFDRMAAEPARAEHQALSMTGAYFTGIIPRVHPILSEQRLEADVGNGMLLSGQADQVCREPGMVRDLKTGMKRGNHRPQIGAYALLARSHGVQVDRAAEDFVKRCGPRTPQADAVSYVHDVGGAETAAMTILHRIAVDLRTYREGDPEQRLQPGEPDAFLANPNSYLCSPKYCAAHGTSWCHEGRTDHKEGDDE